MDAVSVETVWHYTTEARAEKILQDGFIRPATIGMGMGERPVVWFSTRQELGLVIMGIIEGGGVQRPRLPREMITEGERLWRFGLSSAELFPWGQLKEAARIRRKKLRAIVSAVLDNDLDPYCWYGSLEPVAVRRCVIESGRIGQRFETARLPEDECRLDRREARSV